jgi:PAS domain S-box-containing protein
MEGPEPKTPAQSSSPALEPAPSESAGSSLPVSPQAAVRESEQRYHAIFTASPLAMALSRMPRGDLVDINGSFLELFALTRSEVIGKTMVELGIIAPASDVDLRNELEARGKVRGFECRRTIKLDEEQLLSLQVDRLTVESEAHLLTTIRDVSEREETRLARGEAREIARLYAEEKELAAANTRSLAAFAYQLRTPLGVVLELTQRLLDDVEIPATLRRALGGIARNAHTLLVQANNSLDAGETAAGQANDTPPETKLLRLVHVVLEHFEALAFAKQIALAVDTADEIAARVDTEKVRCILSNLVANALAFTPGGGRVRISLLGDAEHAFLEVADSGPGISLEERESVFERPQRAGAVRVGLSMARELATELHGAISISEAPEGGALFLLMLPRFTRSSAASDSVDGSLAHSRAPHIARRPPKAAARQKPLVLIVEDNREMSGFVARHLASQYHVECAFDGREGLQKAKALKPDLILTDTVMPGMSGKELVLRVRSEPELNAVPIVILSAMIDDELRVDFLRRGAQDYITKPFAVAELRVRVANLIQKKATEEWLQRIASDQNLLAETGAVLATTLDYDETCANLAELAVRNLADFCFLEMLDDVGDVHRLTARHRDPSQRKLADALERMNLDLREPHMGSSVLITGKRRVINRVTNAYLESISQHDAHRAALRELGPKAILGLPLHAHGHMVGVMVLVRTSPNQPFVPRDVEVAEEVARRAALAVDNARLYRRARRAVQVRDEVLGIVAHDLRDPLNAMLLQLRALRRVGRQPERRSQEYLEGVLREGGRLNRMIQDLLDVARMEAGTFSIQPESLSLRELAEEAIAAYGLLAREACVKLLLEHVTRDAELIADRFRIHQALGNLIGNAIKFTPAGGTVVLAVISDGSQSIFSVADTGPGIAPEELAHLFDRFWQARASDRRGTGLGLSIAKAIVEAHGGRIWVDTRLGAGSTFSFALPLSGPRNPQSA